MSHKDFRASTFQVLGWISHYYSGSSPRRFSLPPSSTPLGEKKALSKSLSQLVQKGRSSALLRSGQSRGLTMNHSTNSVHRFSSSKRNVHRFQKKSPFV